jgi:superfamily II DNA or RNA helicase
LVDGLRDYPFRISYGPSDDRLHAFYLPALGRSIAYDRSAGFFSSSALAVAASGVARLVRNGGRMRLLVGAKLAPEDIEAVVAGAELAAVVRQRLLEGLATPEDELLRDRLAALAWMVAEGTLEIRVVLPCDPDGRPLPAEKAEEYFHAKEGVFTDAHGDRTAFSGSVNESAHGWRRNYEQFAVYFSWNETRPYLDQVVHRFERLWQGEELGWVAQPLPEAVRQRLLAFRPALPPERDPLERAEAVGETRGVYEVKRAAPREAVLARYLRDAPLLVGADGLGLATAPVVPWPHQVRVARALVDRFPERFLLADEVGLGKTVEAGLALRQLVLSGRVRRALLLAPHSVLRQWQEELHEKFRLDVPRYEDGRLWSVRGEGRKPPGPNPFAAEPLLLLSSQLAKRRDRAEQVLEAGPWDLVVVDEAHHARRRGVERGPGQPNQLLALLRELSRRTRGLWLLSATPMQLHPSELWDLLALLGLGGTWGAGPQPFLRFIAELGRGTTEVDWSTVLPLVREEVAVSGLDPAFSQQAEGELGAVGWEQVRAVLTGRSTFAPQHLDGRQRAWLVAAARRHAPLARLMFRHTRPLLRRYVERGLLHAKVPEREPRPVWVSMTPAEQALYERVEEYIVDFYARYEAKRRGLGFVMTIYRRRLTSSLYAVRCSLQRRLEYLRQLRPDLGLTDEDLEQAELDEDVSEELPEALPPDFAEEAGYLEEFVRDLALLGQDSKFQALLTCLEDLFRSHETVAVFTQYTDTMDDLRERLRAVYGGQVACYSGRGGEAWRDGAWRPVTKEAIKNAFRDGEVKLLVCTDAASEGLNLQTCGALVNYDLPWNPMRVEQRIGRFDRIGQRYSVVHVRNLFYDGTIEAEVYRRLSDRIDWFRAVVGHLQPILNNVAQAIERLALQPRARREQELRAQVAEIERKMVQQEQDVLMRDAEFSDGEVQQLPASPVQLADLARVVPSLPGLAERFRPHPDIEGGWLVSWHDRLHPVTFDRDVFDAHSDTVRLLTYGEPLLNDLLEAVASPATDELGAVMRVGRAGDPPLCGYYRPVGGQAAPVTSLADLEQALASEEAWSLEAKAAARLDFEARCDKARRGWQEREDLQRRLLASQVVARGQRLLVEAAQVEVVLGRRPDLFEGDYPFNFEAPAVADLRRHGYPFAPLMKLVGLDGLAARADDPQWEEVSRLSVEQLKRRWRQLKEEAERLVKELADAATSAPRA